MIINGKNMHEFSGTRVKIMVTSQCTASCKHCCLNFSGTRESSETRSIIDALKDKYELRLDGSELLLDEEYIRLMRIIGQNNVQTNGRLILQNPNRCIRILKENDIREVYFSYHYGIQEYVNDISLKEVEQAIEIIKAAGFRIALMSTVTKSNMHLVKEMCEKAVELGAFFIQINPLLLQGRAKTFMQDDVFSREDRERLRQQLISLNREYSHSLIVDIGKGFELGSGEEFYCRAVTKKVWIGIDNKVYPCIYLIEPGMEIGIYQDGKVWVEDCIKWGGKRCAAYLYCNEHINLWGNRPNK